MATARSRVTVEDWERGVGAEEDGGGWGDGTEGRKAHQCHRCEFVQGAFLLAMEQVGIFCFCEGVRGRGCEFLAIPRLRPPNR